MYVATFTVSYILYEQAQKPEEHSKPIHIDRKTFSIDIDETTPINAITKIKEVCQTFMSSSNQTKVADLITQENQKLSTINNEPILEK